MSATRTDRPEPGADRIVRSREPEQRFRASTVEEALAQARATLGPDVEIVEANRIRRGGIGGFFATELGVEIVARSHGTTERSDVFEPFDGIQLGAPATAATTEPGREPRPTSRTARRDRQDRPDRAAELFASTRDTRPPAPRPWSVDQSAHVVADPTVPVARARQAWRDATGEAGPAAAAATPVPAPARPGDRGEQLEMPGMTGDAGGAAEGTPEPTTFADHFLRELIQDAEELRRTPDRNRMLPVRDLADPAERDRDEPAPVRRRTATMAAGGAGPTATAPMGEQLPLAGTPSVTPPAIERAVAAEPAAAAAVTDTPTLPGMPAPVKKPARAPRAKRSGTGRVRSTAERLAEAAAAEAAAAEAAAAEAAAAEAAAAEAAAAEAAAADTGARALIGGLIDQCVQLTSAADAGAEKIALAVTLPDGSIMKVSIERPRRGRTAREGA